MQEHEEIRQLFERYREGRCTAKEEARVHAWFNHYAKNQAHGLDELQKMYEADRTYKIKKWVHWLPYAAAVILAVAVGFFFLDAKFNAQEERKQDRKVAAADIAPGRSRATLSFADGQTIDLSDEKTGIVIGERVSYLDGSEVSDGNGNLSSNIPRLMSLSTPKGGTYQITLPDGTRVWLNAASTLRYPSRFEGNERIVEIEGEGYFSVVNDKERPFKVISRDQEIEVLGTEFNIASYPDDNEAKTTLVEGKVKVSSLMQVNQKGVLIPGQQAITRGANIDVQTVDVAQYVAWKEGNFHFDNISLAELMKQISRWYDVEVIYRNTVPQERFSGGMSRNVTLQTVLELLRMSEIKYRVEGSKLIIE